MSEHDHNRSLSSDYSPMEIELNCLPPTTTITLTTHPSPLLSSPFLPDMDNTQALIPHHRKQLYTYCKVDLLTISMIALHF